jgi:hypothetical protein
MPAELVSHLRQTRGHRAKDRTLVQGAKLLKQASDWMLAELKEFASFTAAEQRYIRRSLEVALAQADAVGHWARGLDEAARIGLQARTYQLLDEIRALIPAAALEPDGAPSLLPLLIRISSFDLLQGKLTSFAAYKFLYERLLGAEVRPWLLSSFCAAATLPSIHPELRAEFIQSLALRDVSAAGWTSREPVFFPEWIEKVPVAVL